MTVTVATKSTGGLSRVVAGLKRCVIIRYMNSRRYLLSALAIQKGATPRELWKSMSREERREFKGLGRITHDFRRTTVRNLLRAGVGQKVAMELPGHLTPSVFGR